MKEKQSVKREMLLIGFGVVVGLIPSLISNAVSAYYQRQQLYLEKRITAVKELSTIYEQVTVLLIPKTEDLLEKYYGLRTGRLKLDRDTHHQLRLEIKAYCRENAKFERELDTQLAIISAVFRKPPTRTNESGPNCANVLEQLDAQAKAGDQAAAERLRELGNNDNQAYVSGQIESFSAILDNLHKQEVLGKDLVALYSEMLDF